MELKKFEEFVNEGFWKSTIERSKSNIKRIEERLPDFFHRDDVYSIDGYDDYFFTIDTNKSTYGIEIYHAPDDEFPKWKYIDIHLVNKKMIIVDFDTDVNLPDEKLTNDEFELKYENDFISTINDILRTLPKSAFK